MKKTLIYMAIGAGLLLGSTLYLFLLPPGFSLEFWNKDTGESKIIFGVETYTFKYNYGLSYAIDKNGYTLNILVTQVQSPSIDGGKTLPPPFYTLHIILMKGQKQINSWQG